MEIKTAALIGLGAIGCTVAPFIQKVLGYENVRIIAGGKRKERIQNNPTIVNGVPYNFFVADPEEKMEPADIVFVTVKHAALKQAVKDIANQVGKDTIILSLMNGIDSEECLGEAYGSDKLLYGLTWIGAINKGTEFTFSDAGEGIMFGEKKNGEVLTERVSAVKRLFDKAGIKNSVPQDMIYCMWLKYMQNVASNSTSAVIRGTYGYYKKLETVNNARIMLMKEVVKVSEKLGTGLSQKDIDDLKDIFNDYPEECKCSMLQDLEAGRQMENDMLCGYLVELGRRCGVETPISEYVYNLLEGLNKINSQL